MKLSIIIATHNRASLIAACLNALVPQTVGKVVEVVVVDSASDGDQRDALKAAINRFMDAGQSNLTLIRLDVPGVSIARNAGARISASDWIATLDDDAIVAPNWLSGALHAIELAAPDTAIIQGRIDPRWPHSHTEEVGPRWRRFLSLVQFDGDFEFGEKPVCSGANMLVRRAALTAVGGYNENFGRVGDNLSSGIDTALTTAVRRAGQRVCFSDRFPVEHIIHENRLDVGWLRQRSKMDGRAEGRLLLANEKPVRIAYQLLKSAGSVSIFSTLLLFLRHNRDMLIRRDVNLGLLFAILEAAKQSSWRS